MKNVFNVKQECIFISLASYAHDIITQKDINAFNGEAMIMAKFIDNHFKKKLKVYSKARQAKLNAYLKDVMGPAFSDKLNASIIMVVSLNYLLSECQHYESKVFFTPLKNKVLNIINILEKSPEYKGELKKANETIVKMLDTLPSNFKTTVDKEKALSIQYKLLYLLTTLHSSIYISDKLEKPLSKLKNILDNYLPSNKLVPIEFSIGNIENNDKVYYLVTIIERLKKIDGYKEDIINKLKNLNFNYLVPNKPALKECDNIIDQLLL